MECMQLSVFLKYNVGTNIGFKMEIDEGKDIFFPN